MCYQWPRRVLLFESLATWIYLLQLSLLVVESIAVVLLWPSGWSKINYSPETLVFYWANLTSFINICSALILLPHYLAHWVWSLIYCVSYFKWLAHFVWSFIYYGSYVSVSVSLVEVLTIMGGIFGIWEYIKSLMIILHTRVIELMFWKFLYWITCSLCF